jgi:DNA-binding MarR family transcriptional regulator
MVKKNSDVLMAHAHTPVSLPDQELLNTGIVRALPTHLLTNRAYLLGLLGREARRRFTHVLGAWELQPSHYGILIMLEAVGKSSQQHLAQTLTIDRANMVALLDLLEQRGFLERQVDLVDRRRHVVQLTTAGQEVLQEIRHTREEMNDVFFAGLDSQEQETLHQLLVKLFLSLTEQPSA